LGFGVWGLGFGVWGSLTPTQTPNPKPQLVKTFTRSVELRTGISTVLFQGVSELQTYNQQLN